MTRKAATPAFTGYSGNGRKIAGKWLNWYNRRLEFWALMKNQGAPQVEGRVLSRRGFIKLGAAVLAIPALPRSVLSGLGDFLPEAKSLAFYNTHTRESLSTTYSRWGQLLPSALREIDHILRDHRTGEIKEIDVRLLDLLHRLAHEVGCSQPFHVISGYRSKRTNDYLRQRSGGVASGSLHMSGQAIDIRLPGCCLRDLRQAALSLKAGGVGYYPRPDFVHLDIGRVRCW
jgi:uncharacterized protein YcbK (DUF882 family)